MTDTSTVIVGKDHAVPVPAGSNVRVLDGGPVFFADRPYVTSTSNQGSVAAGASRTFALPTWLAASTASTATVSTQAPIPTGPAFGATLVPAPSGDASGLTDQAVITSLIASAGTNATLQFQAGTYVVAGLSANVAAQHWLLPANCMIQLAAGVNAVLLTVDAANVAIEGPGILDANSAVNQGTGNFGVHFNVGAVGSTLKGATVQNTYKAGVLIYPSGVTVQGCTILNTVIGPGIFAQPGTLADLQDIHIYDNIVDKSSQSPATAQGYGIQLHGGPTARTFTATSTLNSVTLASVSDFTGIANGLAITGANIPLGAVVNSFNSGAGTITMNLKASAAGSFTVTSNYALRGIRVSRNKVLLPVNAVTTMLAIEVWGFCPGAVVEGNRTYGGYMGISMDRADNATVTANNVENYVANGIEVANCTNVTVSSNTIDGSVLGGDGVILDGLSVPTTKCTVIGNSIVRTTAKSIFVISSGDHTSIVGNTITTSYGLNNYGIYVQNAPHTVVAGNMLFCFSAASFDAVLFEGSASSGGVVTGNVMEGWPHSAVGVWAGSAQTVDQIVLGPNVILTTPAVFTAWGSATAGSKCRVGAIDNMATPAGVSAITVGASPFTYTNADHVPEAVYISGGTVSSIAKNAVTLATATPATSPVTVWLEPSESVVTTYSVAPTMQKDRK